VIRTQSTAAGLDSSAGGARRASPAPGRHPVRWTLAALGPLALLVFATALGAQSGRLEGTVWGPNGRPIAGAIVTLLGTPVTSLTSESGRFAMNVAPGVYTLRARRIGHVSGEVASVLVRPSATSRVAVGLGPRPAHWEVLDDSLLLGAAPSRPVLLYVDSLGLVPTPGDSAHRRMVVDSAMARGLRLGSDIGGVMIFWISAAASWDTLAARDSAFKLAHALRRDLPTLVKQAGPVMRYRSGGAPSVATDEAVVRFDSSLSQRTIDSLNARVGARPAYRNPFAQNEFLVQALDHDGIALSNAYWLLVGPPAIRSAYPNFRFRTVPTAGSSGDPLSRDQWHFRRINVRPAWSLATGAPVVAVIEQDGFESGHPDLKNQLWQNPSEQGADEDGNRLVGDQNGWNFTDCSSPETTLPHPGPPTDPPACGTRRLTSPNVTPKHGTPVAGLVAAERNGVGVVGVCPGCRLMLIVVDGNDANSQQLGFQYAKDNNADAVNVSWRLGIRADELPPAYLAVVTSLAHERAVIASAGNEDRDFCTGDEAGFQAIPDVIVVGASNQRDKRIRSGRGECVTVLAPAGKGTDLTGATTTDANGASGFNSEEEPRCMVAEFRESAVPNREYTRCFGGTSAAAPIVSGVVGLMLAVDPGLTGPDIEQILEETADKIDAAAADYDATGRSVTHGYGRVNACAAVRRVAGDPDWRDCANRRPWFCRWWVLLLAALIVAGLVFFILSRGTGTGYQQGAPPGRPLWVRLALSVLAGAVVFLLLWLFCELLILAFCLLAGVVVAVAVFLAWRTGPLIWRFVVSLLAGVATFGLLWVLLRGLA
jgi:subtilisin family serine protease